MDPGRSPRTRIPDKRLQQDVPPAFIGLEHRKRLTRAIVLGGLQAETPRRSDRPAIHGAQFRSVARKSVAGGVRGRNVSARHSVTRGKKGNAEQEEICRKRDVAWLLISAARGGRVLRRTFAASYLDFRAGAATCRAAPAPRLRRMVRDGSSPNTSLYDREKRPRWVKPRLAAMPVMSSSGLACAMRR